MNKHVEELLNCRLNGIEADIKWERDAFTGYTRALEVSSKKLDRLNQERRAIKDHLEVSK